MPFYAEFTEDIVSEKDDYEYIKLLFKSQKPGILYAHLWQWIPEHTLSEVWICQVNNIYAFSVKNQAPKHIDPKKSPQRDHK